MLDLPRSARLAAWGSAWLTGRCSLDEVLDRVVRDDEPHVCEDLPGGATGGLAGLLGALRAAGASGLRLALPRAGDVRGLPGPPALSAAAVEAGEAVLAAGTAAAVVPEVVAFGPPGDQGHLVTWRWWSTADRVVEVPTLAAADRDLTEQLLAAAASLTDLDVAAWRPEVTRLLDDVRSGAAAQPLPDAYPPRSQALAARAVRLAAVVELAGADDGGALTATAATARQAALRPLERACRQALVAACGAILEPVPSRG